MRTAVQSTPGEAGIGGQEIGECTGIEKGGGPLLRLSDVVGFQTSGTPEVRT